MDIYKNLNENQQKAVNHFNGPCLVVAGAGSGKTRVLTSRIASLIYGGVYAQNILAITFTNKAANEMRERLRNFDVKDVDKVFVGTFHSFGLKIIRENLEYLNLDRNFTILDSDDVLSIIKKILKNNNIDPKSVSPSYVKNRISYIKNELLSEREISLYFSDNNESIVVDIYNEYQEILKKNNSVDFDDLLLLPTKLFMENDDILDKYQEHYKYILIDEYQDTNKVQYIMTKLLAAKYRNLFAVGDPDQSIYMFRGANYKNILNFEKDYPDAKIIPLLINYRSTQNILSAANGVISHNIERKEKDLKSLLGIGEKIKFTSSYDEKHEITLVVEEINKLHNQGYDYKDIAIFYRTNAQSRTVEEGMLKANLPYKVVGSYYFYSRKEIKNLICYLRLIVNPHDDVSLRRVINVPKRGIGDKYISDLEEKTRKLNISMFDAIDDNKGNQFKNIILKLQKDSENLSLTELVDKVLNETGMKEELMQDESLENELRLDNLNEFKSITASFEGRTGNISISDFLEEISLVADIEEHKVSDDAITLMTLHSAKGLEFKVVFIVGMEDGIFPHQNSFTETGGLEEERRLCYVGITRAKEKLYLSNARKRMLYGKENLTIPSRFLKEIPSDLMEETSASVKSEKKIDKTKVFYDEEQEYQVGQVVMHTIYGRGVVVGIDDKFVSIAFNKRFGIRKLMKNHSSIRKV